MNIDLPFGLGFRWVIFQLAAVFLVHAFFAIGVLGDAGRQREQRRELFLVGAWTWALATLVGGVTVAGIYWLIHHSALRATEAPKW